MDAQASLCLQINMQQIGSKVTQGGLGVRKTFKHILGSENTLQFSMLLKFN